MMTRSKTLLAALLLVPLGAWAADTTTTTVTNETQTHTDNAGNVQNRSVVTQQTTEKGGLLDEAAAITLQAGVVNLKDAAGATDTRGLFGFSIDGNFLSGLRAHPGKPFFGPSVGVLYSHLGWPDSNFVGTNSPSTSGDGSHLLLLPLDLKAGYTFNNSVRLSAHGGALVSYLNTPGTSVTVSTAPGSTTTTTSNFRNENWDVSPNVGLDLELGLGRSALFLLRPDWSFMPSGTTFTGTLGFGFPLS